VEERERIERIEELTEFVKLYPFVPVFKTWEEVRDSLVAGNADFIVDADYWRGIRGRLPLLPGLHVRRTAAWNLAEAGYRVWARSLEEVRELVQRTIEATPESFVYFRVICPEVFPERSFVDEDMGFHRMELEALRRGAVPRELQDI